MTMKQRTARQTAVHHTLLLLILLTAFALRLHQLAAQSLWWDEGISLHLASSTLPTLLADRLNNIHPPLYFILLKGWVALVGVSPFAARYSSVLAAFLQVALGYAAARHWFRTAPFAPWLALILLTLSPLSVIYGQEIRVYAWLPLVYLLLLLLTWRFVDGRRVTAKQWLLFGAVAWIGLHLHYIAAFVLLYVGLWLLLALGRQRRWPDLRGFVVTVLLVGLGALPWFTAVWQNWSAVQAEANAGTYLTDPVPLDYLLHQVWSFHFSGLAGTEGDVWIRPFTLLSAILILTLGIWRTADPRTRRTTLRLAGQWFLPLSAALFVWSVRSFSHPRYIAFAGVGILLLIAWLAGSSWRSHHSTPFSRLVQKGLALLLIALVTAVSLRSLHLYFTSPAAAKDNVRGVAQLLAQEATPNDLILIPDTDWSLPFEYSGSTPVLMPNVTNPAAMWPALSSQTATPRRIFVLDYERGTRDFQQVVPYLLEQQGWLTAVHPFGDIVLREYQVNAPITPPTFTPTHQSFGPLTLTGYAIEPHAAADTAVAIALQWQVNAPLPQRYHAKLTLHGLDGFMAGETADLLLDPQGAPSEIWPVDATITTYHVLPLTPGVPPLPHDLALTLFHVNDNGPQAIPVRDAAGAPQGEQTWLTQLSLTNPIGSHNPYTLASPVPPQPRPLGALTMEGASLSQPEIAPGQSLYVYLLWRGMNAPTAAKLQPTVQLQQGEAVLASADSTILPLYPTTDWPPDALVAEQRRLLIPPDAAGTAEVVVQLNGRTQSIGHIQINAEARQFTPPTPQYPLDIPFGDVAQLVGFDLPSTAVAVNEAVPLTLYWRSQQTGVPTAYTVFTQLLAKDGRLVGQHDAAPANGRRPTTGWVADEYVTDDHLLQWHEPYTGTAVILVGLYDPQTGIRLTLPDGADALHLPVSVTVNGNP